MNSDLPEWVRRIATPEVIGVLTCGSHEDAAAVKKWLKNKMPEKEFCIVNVPPAHCWVVFSLLTTSEDGPADATTNSQSK